MARKYQPAKLADGSPNPRYYVRNSQPCRKKFLPDGTINPRYTPRRGPRPPDPPHVSKWERGAFVAWDGEGAEVGGRHRYIMLRSSANDGAVDGGGVSSTVLLDALAEGLAKHADSIHVGFAFGYDVNMILADMPRLFVRRLWAGQWVRWRRFTMQYRQRKSFMLRQHLWNGTKWTTRGGVIWDVFGFFQSSFVKALHSYDVGTSEERERIAAMKAERSTFTPEQLPEIQRYCEHECRLLVRLMKRLHEHLTHAGLKVSRWDGAGAVAAALLKRQGVKAFKGSPPTAVLSAARHAYAGGRIEAVRYGHTTRPVYHYDIRSAYPAATVNLPCLAHGEWVHNPPVPARESFAVCRVRFAFGNDDPLYPFFWRAPDGAIYFPREGEGWYWSPEIRAAWDAGTSGQLHGRLDVLESWAWRPTCDHKPFVWLPELYEQRARWKREGIGAEKALKLAINSLYGKCAQQVGGRDGKPPAYHQLEWAGWITSTTRAMLYRAALPAALTGDLVMMATDAVYATRPLPLGGTKLGEWEGHEHAGVTVVQSGVYWTGQGDDTAAYYRGFDPGSLSRDAVLKGWRYKRASVDGTSSRFVGMGLALAGARSWDKWCRWVTTRRALALHPEAGKRAPVIEPERARPHRGLMPTRPVTPSWHWLDGKDASYMSAPIRLPWIDGHGAGQTSEALRSVTAADDESQDGQL